MYICMRILVCVVVGLVEQIEMFFGRHFGLVVLLVVLFVVRMSGVMLIGIKEVGCSILWRLIDILRLLLH